MLKSIRLQNFFGFQDCTINLEKGANVLVGINGSGKSNFFKAVRVLRQISNSEGITDILYSEFGGFDNIFFAKKNADQRIYFDLFLGDPKDQIDWLSDYHSYLYSCQIKSGYSSQVTLSEDITGYGEEDIITKLATSKSEGLITEFKGEKKLHKIKDHSKSILSEGAVDFKSSFSHDLKSYLTNIELYDNIDTTKNSPIRKPNPPRIDKYLLSDGNNLASLLNDIKLSDKHTYNKIVGALKNVNGKYVGVEFKQLSGFIEMWLEEDGLNRAVSPIHISDGTLKFLCLMAILYNPNRGSVVCIDEPELGLHPDMISTLHEAIEFAAETSQIIISTHSAHLLNYFELEQVRVFEKDENNATIVNQFSKEEFAGWQQKFQLGKAWREGVIGGKRW